MTGGARRRQVERRYRRAALIAGLIAVLSFAAVFVRGNPLGDGYEMRALFTAANAPAIGADVRIAGVRVGEVAAIGAGRDGTSVVTMRIDDVGRPIHADATAAIVPRLILEGSSYVRLEPGTPGAPELRDGATLPLSRTAGPVQLDQVLNVLDLPTRGSLHRAVGRVARGLGARPDAAGGTGAQGLRRAVQALDAALPSVGTVARAARGQRPGDLGAAVRGTAATTSQLGSDPGALAAIVTNIRRVSGALAAEDRALGATVVGLDRVLATAPAALRALDGTLTPLTDTAAALRPALRAAPGPLRRTGELLEQLGALSGDAELRGLLADLAPVSARLPHLQRGLRRVLPVLTDVTECLRTRVVPTLERQVPDGPRSTGDPAWLDLVHAFTGLTGASPTFDGNGVSTRAGLTQGLTSVDGVIPGFGRFVGSGPELEGVRPTWLGYGKEPPYRPDARCADQSPADLSKRSGPPPAWQRDAVRSAAGRRP